MKYFNHGGAVLEVGSGHRPYPQSDVLVDKFLDESQRGGRIQTDGRPLFVSDIEELPFVDNSFAYSIASHVVEHVEEPAKALKQLSRVSKSGYIETPSALMEVVEPHRNYHLWHVKVEERELIFIPKKVKKPFHQNVTWKLSENNFGFRLFYHGNPELFLTRFDWREKIPFRITKRPFHPDEYLSITHQNAMQFSFNITKKLSAEVTKAILKMLAVRRKPINIGDIVRCPRCHGSLEIEQHRIHCDDCKGYYPRKGDHYFLSKEFFSKKL